MSALLFVAGVVCVYIFALGFLVTIFLEKKRGTSPRRSQIYTRRAVFSLAFVGIGCFAYGYFIEPYWPQVTRITLESAKIPNGSALRIVHISDVHSDPHVRLEQRLPELVAKQNPDLILFSGDAVNSVGGIPIFRQCMASLAKIAPVYAVRGNWDFSIADDLFADTGAHELNGEPALVNVRGIEVWIGGTAVSGAYRMHRMLNNAPRDIFSIFLYHYPDEIYIASSKVDLYAAGHTHGGQVALPFWGALVTFSRYGKRFESGLYRVGDTYLYVNRGIGMRGDFAPRVRFLARPEITVYDIIGNRGTHI